MNLLVKRCLRFFKQTVHFLLFVLRLVYHGNLSNPFKVQYKGTVAMLANGPSLKDVIARIQSDEEFHNVDFIVLNYFAFEDCFSA